ncbi:type IV pilus assembly protein PilC [Desulfotomaculum arcticum]|uniref:Type IV pilus assembly protein PilC n=1 Tax=Desulfotruncus arcticus DSM 17038 TaxID=1121424 RepID=A0A1I2MMF8_9FIRM|nr:type II secretion system F family protein [Desulfotruncus arcticus]SFF92735.1 type IV pilus assembly protein PilC [Desulfotomaculum arcticum] [Desulfotruncus arcticus DSM 17038]
MPLYTYEAIDEKGLPVSGKMEAEQENSAVAKLKKMGYMVIDLAEVKNTSLTFTFAGRRKIKIGDISFFSRQLSAMLIAGIPLTRCLFTLQEQTSNPTLSKIIGEVAKSVESGVSFSDALRAYPETFSSMYVDMIKAGEISGSIEEMLRRLSDQLERSKHLQDQIRAATFYPSVVLIFAFCVVMALMIFVVPIFVGFFPEGVSLPLPTRIVVGISNVLRGYWHLCLLFMVLFVFGLRYYLSSTNGKKAWDMFRFRLPVMGDLFKKTTIASFSRTLSTLLSGGIPVLQALEAAGPASGSIQVAEAVKQTGYGIQEGQSIAFLLKKSGFFPPMLVNMVAVGEETGQLSTLLGRVADFYEEEVAAMTKGLTAMLEPVLLIVVGITIGSIVIAVYLPIFTVVTSVGQ